MITLRTISITRRRLIFIAVAIVDITLRLVSAQFQFDHILFGATSDITQLTSMSAASGLAVPAIAAPLFLSPIAYVIGQIFVLAEANYVRLVSAAFMVGSFLTYTTAPGLSVFVAMLAYLILGSGMIAQRSQYRAGTLEA